MSRQLKYSDIAILLCVSVLSLVANLPDSLSGHLIDKRLVLATLICVVVIAMFRYLQVLLLGAICILALGANLPQDMAASLGISKPALIISLGVLIALTVLNRVTKLLPTGVADAGSHADIPAADIRVARLALLNAISRGDMVVIQGLLAMKVGVNFVQDGTTPLHMAADKGYSEVVQFLLDQGANFRIENARGQTPLEVALEHKKFVRTTEILFKASRHDSARQAASDQGGARAWRE